MTRAMLVSVEGLSVRRGDQVILDDVSFELARGELLAVVGESGSGKTMIARSILRLLPPGLRQTAGRIEIDGEDIGKTDERRMRQLRGGTVGMVFQEPMMSLNPTLTVGTQMLEAMRLHLPITESECRDRAIEMLRRVQIQDPATALKAFPHEFSGGMRQRIMLASVMLLRPKLLIADEPTTALDNLTQREVLDLMTGLARDSGTAVLLITHNLGIVNRYTQNAIVMCRGQLVERNTTSNVLRRPRHPYTRGLVAALPRRRDRRESARESGALIEVRDLKVVYEGRRRIFGRSPAHVAVRGVDLSIWPGEIVALVGGSGSGKTTLGRAVMGLAPISAGSVRVRGIDLVRAAPAERRDARHACQLIFQDPYASLDPRMRVAQIVEEPLRHEAGLTPAAQVMRVEEVLDQVGLSGFGARYPHELSGGQRQRVAIARAVIRRPSFVVADEPVSALDMTIQSQVLGLIRSLQADHGFACLFISHDMGAVEQVADRIVVMQDGRIVEEGEAAQVLDHPRADYTRALIEATPTLDIEDPSDGSVALQRRSAQ